MRNEISDKLTKKKKFTSLIFFLFNKINFTKKRDSKQQKRETGDMLRE